MVGLAGSRWALESDQAKPTYRRPSVVEEAGKVPPNESITSEDSTNSGSLGVTEQRNTNKLVGSTGLESQSEKNPPEMQGSNPRQANLPAIVGLVGSRWNSAETLPTSTPQNKRRPRKGKKQRRNTNQARSPQSMAAEMGQFSQVPSNAFRVEVVQQPWASNVPAQEPSNISSLPSNTSRAALAYPSWTTNALASKLEEDSEDEIL